MIPKNLRQELKKELVYCTGEEKHLSHNYEKRYKDQISEIQTDQSISRSLDAVFCSDTDKMVHDVKLRTAYVNAELQKVQSAWLAEFS